MRFTHGIVLAGALAFAFASAPAHAEEAPDLTTTSALVQVGGGAGAFSGKALVRFLSGTKSQYDSEVASLTDKFGAASVTSFLDVLTFIFNDATKQISAMPSPNPDVTSDPESLAEAFYKDGASNEGFSTANLFDKLLGHDVHANVAKAVTEKYGEKAVANFEAVFGQTMSDMKAGYDL